MAQTKQSFFQRGKNTVANALKWVKDSVQKKWQQYHLTTVTIAATSATSTLRTTFEILPIVTTVLTVIAAAPLFEFLVPGFLFSPWIYIPAIIGVSGYAGYLKYHELIQRTKLDLQIMDNQQQLKGQREVNEKLERTVTALQNTLKETQKSLGALQKQLAKSINPLRDNQSIAKNDSHNVLPRRSPRLAKL